MDSDAESLEKNTLKLMVDVLYYDTPRPVAHCECVFPREKKDQRKKKWGLCHVDYFLIQHLSAKSAKQPGVVFSFSRRKMLYPTWTL